MLKNNSKHQEKSAKLVLEDWLDIIKEIFGFKGPYSDSQLAKCSNLILDFIENQYPEDEWHRCRTTQKGFLRVAKKLVHIYENKFTNVEILGDYEYEAKAIFRNFKNGNRSMDFDRKKDRWNLYPKSRIIIADDKVDDEMDKNAKPNSGYSEEYGLPVVMRVFGRKDQIYLVTLKGYAIPQLKSWRQAKAGEDTVDLGKHIIEQTCLEDVIVDHCYLVHGKEVDYIDVIVKDRVKLREGLYLSNYDNVVSRYVESKLPALTSNVIEEHLRD